MAKYAEIRDSLKTGDIVLFSGQSQVSGILKWFKRSKWSHVGMVVKLPQFDAIMLWESTLLSSATDVETGMPSLGVRLVPLSQRIGGEVAIRRLENVVLSQEDIDKLSALRVELRGRPYERNPVELFKSVWDLPFGRNEEDLSSVFCSELVAEAYQALGLLPEEQPSNEYTPADFSSERFIPLLKGATLGPEEFVEV